MDIIIGREEGARRLRCMADGREFAIGAAGSVPFSVSRQHCKLTVNGSTITIENIKPQNITFVDGNQIVSKRISATSKVQLGEERYLIPLQQILQLATGVPPAPPQPTVPTFSLNSLEKVWEEYESRKLEIQNNAAKSANNQRLQGVLSMLRMCIGFIPGIPPISRIVIMGAALSIAVYFFIKGSMSDTVQQKLHDLDEEYAKKYKCPNPKCGKPFGSIPYYTIKYNKQCVACGCKYTH